MRVDLLMVLHVLMDEVLFTLIYNAIMQFIFLNSKCLIFDF